MMTTGMDVSSLYVDMIRLVGTQSFELKRLAHLYITHHAQSMPEHTILATCSLQCDSRNRSNPLIRAIAIRTIGSLRTESITEYLCNTVLDALLHDDDAFVRKTAAVAVGKIQATSPRLVKDFGFIKALHEVVLRDTNAVVVANAVASLLEISQATNKNYLPFKRGD